MREVAEDRCWPGFCKKLGSLSIGFISAAADGSSSLLPDTRSLSRGAFLVQLEKKILVPGLICPGNSTISPDSTIDNPITTGTEFKQQ
jgi:hypothetical protein